MLNQFSRTELLLGKAAMERLAECRVAVFGIGGVGGYVCEALAISCRSHCICPPGTKRHCTDRRDIPGSTAFVPSAAGLIIAGYSVSNVNLSTVIAYKEDGVKHHFLDSY